MPDRAQSLTITNRIHRRFGSQAVSVGVPWPKALLTDPANIALQTVDGQPVPVAATVLNRWPDGSVQWTLLDFVLDLEPSSDHRLIVAARGGTSAAAPASPVTVEESADTVTVGNGQVRLILGRRGTLVRAWTVEDRAIVEPGSLDLVVTDADDKEFRATLDENRQITIEHANPLRAVVRVDGIHTAADGATLLHYWLKFTVTAGRSAVKVSYHFRNREQPVPGITVRELRLAARLGVPAGAPRSITQRNRGRQYMTAAIRVPDDFEIFSSDTPLLDRYQQTHVDGGAGGVYIRQPDVLRQHEEEYPWFLRKAAGDFDPSLPLKFRGVYAERALWPYLGVSGPAVAVCVVPLGMAGLHPKSLRIVGNEITYGLWPAWAGPLPIRQGAGKTHEMVITGRASTASDHDFQTEYLSWEMGVFHHAGEATDPVGITPDTDWIRSCEVFHVHRLPAYDPVRHFRFERKLARQAVYGVPGGSVTGTPASGMWNYGDYALICNNDNMASLRHFQDYLRSGNWDHARRGLNACQHVIDVDYVDYSVYPYQHRGMVAHCPGHNAGAVYPSHEWISDLFLAYAVSGNPEFKTIALNMCENVLYWVNDPDGFPVVAADHREAGQPMVNLAWAYEFNPDPRYLAACEKIFRDVYQATVRQHGRLLIPKPNAENVAQLLLYGDWACWKGLFYYWCLTRDEDVRQFFLQEVDHRIQEERAPTGGDPRAADVDMAAFAFYMTGDRHWIDRFARVFKMMFDASAWEWTWEHSMYYCKLALELGIVTDEDVRL